jgi:hypothetical protein
MFSYGLASLIRQHAVEVDDAVAWLDGLGRLAGRQADVVLWLSAPVSETIARAEARDGRQWTGEQRAYLTFVDRAYQELAARDAGMVKGVDGRAGAGGRARGRLGGGRRTVDAVCERDFHTGVSPCAQRVASARRLRVL